MENENLPLILVMEVAKYLRCTTTTLIRFHNNQKHVNDAHHLERWRAYEILEFILTDTDRHYKANTPTNNPIAYALKGPSINMDTMRLMIEEVRDKCKEEDVNILTEVTDGQFQKIVCRTIDDKPLTWL